MCNGCRQKIVRIQNKLRAIELLGGKCIDCGNDDPIVLTFHHVDPADKELNIASHMNKSWESLEREIQKCVLLCANCHIVRHTDRDEALAYLSRGVG